HSGPLYTLLSVHLPNLLSSFQPAPSSQSDCAYLLRLPLNTFHLPVLTKSEFYFICAFLLITHSNITIANIDSIEIMHIYIMSFCNPVFFPSTTTHIKLINITNNKIT